MPAQHLVATVEQIKNDLAKVPEMDDLHRRISTREAIRTLSEEIRGLQKRGHSLQSIATMLTGKGIEIKPNTLKMYLRKRTIRRQPREEARDISIPAPNGAQAIAEHSPAPPQSLTRATVAK